MPISFDTSFTACQHRFSEHLGVTQPCLQLAEWFPAVLAPFFAYLTHQGVHSVDGITPAHVEAYRAQLLETAWSPSQKTLCWEAAQFPQAKQPLMLLTPAQWFLAVRLFLHWLWQTGVLLSNPADDVTGLSPNSQRQRGLDELDAESILLASGLAVDRRQPPLDMALALRNRAVLFLLYRDGVSPHDLRAAKVSPASLACGELYTHPRGSGARRIALSPFTLAHVRAYLDHGRPHIPHTQPQPALFLTVDGVPFDGTTLRAVVQEAATQAGLSQAVTPAALHTAGRAHQRPQPYRIEPNVPAVSVASE